MPSLKICRSARSEQLLWLITTRSGFRPVHRRGSSDGLSRRTVLAPTIMASYPVRSRCISVIVVGDEITAFSRLSSLSTKRSADSAHFSVT